MHQAHAIPEAATRDKSKLVDAVQSSRGEPKTPLDAAVMDPPGQPQQARDTPHAPPAPAGDAVAQAKRSHDILLAHDTPLTHGVQLLNTARDHNNSDPLSHSDGIVDPNPVQSDNKNITDAPFPVISSADYANDAEFSGMFLYLHDGTLSGNVKKDKPILIMEDKYIIDEDGLLYRVDI